VETPIDLQPSDSLVRRNKGNKAQTLLLACGALAREIVDLVELNGWSAFDIQCLPAKWHNTPQLIVPALREAIRDARDGYQKIYVVYGDCGTGGLLDAMLEQEGVGRINGPHCYAFYSGNEQFVQHTDEDLTVFYLTDYLARQFDKLVWQGLGLDRHPELLRDYFGNYTKLVYLAQTHDKILEDKAEAAARQLGLVYEFRFTGYGELATELERLA
jgi:Protein of unknown function (DUF1638)